MMGELAGCGPADVVVKVWIDCPGDLTGCPGDLTPCPGLDLLPWDPLPGLTPRCWGLERTPSFSCIPVFQLGRATPTWRLSMLAAAGL